MSVSSREPGVVVVNPDCRRCGRKLANESDLLVGLCNNSEACERRRVAQEQLFAVDPLDSLRELRDDLAHDEDRSFVNTANEVIDQWSTERSQHAAALASRDARIEELEKALSAIRKVRSDGEPEGDDPAPPDGSDEDDAPETIWVTAHPYQKGWALRSRSRYGSSIIAHVSGSRVLADSLRDRINGFDAYEARMSHVARERDAALAKAAELERETASPKGRLVRAIGLQYKLASKFQTERDAAREQYRGLRAAVAKLRDSAMDDARQEEKHETTDECAELWISLHRAWARMLKVELDRFPAIEENT